MSAQDEGQPPQQAEEALAKRKDLYEEAMWRGWLAVRKRVLKREGKCASGCQARREAVVRYLEKKTRREFKNLFKCAAVRVDNTRD